MIAKQLIIGSISIAFIISAFSANSINPKDLHPHSKTLAYCANSLAYAGNYYLINDDLGLVRFLIFHHARTYAALLYINIAGTTDPKKAIELGKKMGAQIRQQLDSNQEALPQIIDECLAKTRKIVNESNLNERKLDGYSFDDYVLLLARNSISGT